MRARRIASLFAAGIAIAWLSRMQRRERGSLHPTQRGYSGESAGDAKLGPDITGRAVSEAEQQAALEYWTEERMASAQPAMPLLRRPAPSEEDNGHKQ